jgi:hypothetical protein
MSNLILGGNMRGWRGQCHFLKFGNVNENVVVDHTVKIYFTQKIKIRVLNLKLYNTSFLIFDFIFSFYFQGYKLLLKT